LIDLLSFDAFFFDFDGLLADTEPLHYKAYQHMLKKRNLTLPWDFKTYCHYAHQKTEVFAEQMFKLFPSLKEEQPNWMLLREEKQKIYQNLLLTESIGLMPGVKKILTLLQKHHKPIYVVTNATQEQVDAIKQHEPLLATLPHWVTRECYARSKPAPDSYLKALEMHGDPHCKGIAFEDAIKGLEALQTTPLTPVLILPENYPTPDVSHCKKVTIFHSFEELLAQDHHLK
jgi:HAD superfamily hydrolase (TIGR01509 family)